MLYVDASALVKRYVEEEGSESVQSAMEAASAWSMCRIGYLETVRAVALAGGRKAVKRVEADRRHLGHAPAPRRPRPGLGDPAGGAQLAPRRRML